MIYTQFENNVFFQNQVFYAYLKNKKHLASLVVHHESLGMVERDDTFATLGQPTNFFFTKTDFDLRN